MIVVNYMAEESKRNSNLEINETVSIQSQQEMPQEPKILQTNGILDSSKIEGPPVASNVLELLSSIQKMNREERRLLEARQYLLAKQQDLQGKLVEEISKKKMAIDVLRSEIPDLQDKIRQLGQVLGIDHS